MEENGKNDKKISTMAKSFKQRNATNKQPTKPNRGNKTMNNQTETTNNTNTSKPLRLMAGVNAWRINPQITKPTST
jgi:hypothetical protein